MIKSKVTPVPIDRLELNEGQLPWLPRNPRSWTQTDIDRMRASLAEDPDFPEERPVLAVQEGPDGPLVVFAHNLLTKVAMLDGAPDLLPCVIHRPEGEEDREAIRRRALKDNGGFGSWDTEILANEWDYEPEVLEDMGIPEWITGGAGGDGQQGSAQGPGEGGSGSGKSVKEDEEFDPNKGILVRCKPGDIWELGDHRLMCGDSTDLETVKTLMGGGIS